MFADAFKHIGTKNTEIHVTLHKVPSQNGDSGWVANANGPKELRATSDSTSIN